MKNDAARSRSALRSGIVTRRGRRRCFWRFARKVSYPLVIKPPAGAGSQATYRADGPDGLREALALRFDALGPGNEALLEEFIAGEEHTFDSVTTAGQHRLAVARRTTARRRSRRCGIPGSSGRCCCRATSPGPRSPRSTMSAQRRSRALGVTDALRHMEWFRRPDGSARRLGGRRPPARRPAHVACAGTRTTSTRFGASAQLIVFDEFTPPHRHYAGGHGFPARPGARQGGRGDPRPRRAAARPRPPRHGGQAAAAGPVGSVGGDTPARAT